jgi:hypothetical protein
MKRLKIFFPEAHYNAEYRSELFDLLKLIINKSGEVKSIPLNWHDPSKINITDSLENCDIVILTMSWNYYYKTKKLSEAIEIIELASQQNKIVFTWTSGDFGVRVPDFSNIIIFRQSGYRSILDKRHIGLPVFIEDPFLRKFNKEISFREKNNTPIIGFCGQSIGSVIKYAYDYYRIIKHNLSYLSNLSKFDPQTIYPSTLLRERVLSIIEHSDYLKSNFIKRKKYRAGAKTKKLLIETTTEFYNNIFESDYVICVRGGGNFSVRFYETLAIGRIPVLIDSDSILPLQGIIDWNKHCVIINLKDLKFLPDRIMEFHNSMSNSDFIELQKENRKLWLNYLRNEHFYNVVFSKIV